jgi:glycosyltransferase involved in cell wall biosynthesis
VSRLALRLKARAARPDIAFGHTFQPPPYGGSNQFLLALRGELERRGFRVGENLIARSTRACLLNSYVFDEEALRELRHPGCRVVHRVDGPLSEYRGFDDGTDHYIAEVNAELADATVVQSRYSLEANEERGFAFVNPVVIPNAVDPAIFRPAAARSALGRRVRLISTSWSDNPNKGAETYRWLEQRLDWDRFEWTFVGRSPVSFEQIRTLPPVGSEELAGILREHDVYVTASRHEPCSNALLEALACGLPAVYRASGGNAELVGEGGVPFTEDDELPGAVERLVDEYGHRRDAIAVASLSEVTDRYLAAMGLDPWP